MTRKLKVANMSELYTSLQAELASEPVRFILPDGVDADNLEGNPAFTMLMIYHNQFGMTAITAENIKLYTLVYILKIILS